MTTLNFGNTVTLKQAASIIVATPMNRYLLQGEPGIGKSSILKMIGTMLPDHEMAYIDVPNMDLGDIAMPVIDHDNKVTRYYPNSRFKLHIGKPVAIMLDEYTKGAEAIKNMLHPLLEVVNPRLGDIPIHPDSIIFLTGNLASDGVGDSLKAHSRNRVIPLTVRKSDADGWLMWAVDNNIDPVVMAWVKQFPQAMASYTDSTQAENPYIYNPKKVQKGFVTPRSLEMVSNIIKRRSQLDTESLLCAMSGAIGESASRDMQAFLEYQDKLPTWEAIINTPATTELPKSAGACAVIIFGAISKVTKETFKPVMEYIERLAPEWQACFAINMANSPSKNSIAFGHKTFVEWVTKNGDIL